MRVENGMLLGRFTIQHALASGGNGATHFAIDNESGEQVVVKFLSRGLTFNAYARAQFRKHVEQLMALHQPSIVPILRFGQLREQTYLVLPHYKNGSLADRLHPKIVELNEIRRILCGIAPALDAAHAAGIVHGNLKPSNILFDGDDQPHVTDFGLDQAAFANSGLLRGRNLRTTGYLSPEQVREGRLDARSDTYALAIMMFEMVTGELPFSAETPSQMLEQHLHATPRKLNNELDMVMRHALAKSPSRRAQSVAELCTMVPKKLTERPRWWRLGFKRRAVV